MTEPPEPSRRPTFLGRLTAAVREQDWFAVALEVVIVVVGVFLGVQLGNWNAARIDRDRADAVVVALADEFVAIRENSEFSVDYHEDNIGNLQALALALDRGEMVEGDSARIQEALAFGMTYNPPTSPPATLIELLASGQMHLVRDDSLRTSLHRYNRRVEVAPEVFLHTRMEQAALDAIRRHWTHSDDVGDPTEGYRLDGAVAFDFDAMRADPEFLADVRRQREYQTHYLIWHAAARDEIAAIQALLAKAAP